MTLGSTSKDGGKWKWRPLDPESFSPFLCLFAHISIFSALQVGPVEIDPETGATRRGGPGKNGEEEEEGLFARRRIPKVRIRGLSQHTHLSLSISPPTPFEPLRISSSIPLSSFRKKISQTVGKSEGFFLPFGKGPLSQIMPEQDVAFVPPVRTLLL